MDNTSPKILAEWIATSKDTQYISAQNAEVETTILKELQLTERSVMGCLIKDLGYIICANRHIRIFGGKNPHCMSFFDVNTLYTGVGILKGVLIIADTSDGGLFALNCDESKGAKLGEVLYLPYRSLTWEQLDIGYSDFVSWSISASQKKLLDGGWIDNYVKNVTLATRDDITQSKLDIVLSIGR